MLTVSNYHYIREKYDAKYPSIFGVTPDAFKNQLELLRNEGDFIAPRDLVGNLEGILASNDNNILITFDDGLKEQFDFALPILDELNIPAVFFANSRNFEEKKVSTVHKIHLLRSVFSPKEFLAKLSDFDTTTLILTETERAKEIYRYDDEQSAELKFLLNFKMDFRKQESIIKNVFDSRFDEDTILNDLYMTEENIIDLAKRDYLGSHTHSHFPIGLLNADEIYFELNNSKLFFEKLTNTKIEMIAYPYGTDEACTDEVAKIADNLGYKVGFTTKRGVNATGVNHLLMNRYDCNDLPGGKNYLKK